MKRILIIVSLVLATLLTLSLRYASQQNKEKERLKENQSVLLRESREYKVRDSLNATTVGVMNLRIDEFKSHFEELNSLIRDMDIKLKRVESLSLNSLESKYEVMALLRDTLIPDGHTDICSKIEIETGAHEEDKALVAVQSLRFSDNYIDLDGLIVDSIFRGTVITYDTLTQVVHRIPRRFLFFRWGTKELRQEIVSSNPHTRITYSRKIKIHK